MLGTSKRAEVVQSDGIEGRVRRNNEMEWAGMGSTVIFSHFTRGARGDMPSDLGSDTRPPEGMSYAVVRFITTHVSGGRIDVRYGQNHRLETGWVDRHPATETGTVTHYGVAYGISTVHITRASAMGRAKLGNSRLNFRILPRHRSNIEKR